MGAYAAFRAYTLALFSGALVCTCLLALIGANVSPWWLGFVLAYVVLGAFASPLFIVGTRIIREREWERPLSDVVLAVASALATWLVLNAEAVWQRAFAVSDLAVVLISAAIAGRIYWSLAGNPESPYPARAQDDPVKARDKR